MQRITQEYLKECVVYNQETGTFTWKYRPLVHFKNSHGQNIINSQKSGRNAGTINTGGYSVFYLLGKLHYAHRLAWLYVHGEFPKNNIDHINHCKTDNRISNLRNTTHRENSRNMIARNNGEPRGVYWNPRNKRWDVSIFVEKKKKHLGCFLDKADAIEARKGAEEKYGYHPNHGRMVA